MILSCPSCATGFQIDDSHIGPDGRMVRCSVCKHTWRAEKAAEPIELKVAVKPKVETTEDLKEVKAKKLPKKYREFVEDQKRQKAMAAQGYVWAALAGSMILALALAFVFRVNIVRTAPALAGAYESVGLRVNGTNLEFESFSAESNFKGGRFVVTVKARIKNLSNKPTPVPPVKVELSDASLAKFDTQTMNSDGLVIGPKSTQTMVFDVKDPKNLARNIDLRFDLEALKAQEQGRKPNHKVKSSGHETQDSHGNADNASHAQADGHESHAEPGHEPEHGTSHDSAEVEHSVAINEPTSHNSDAPLRGSIAASEHIEAPTQSGHSANTEPAAHAQDHAIRQAH